LSTGTDLNTISNSTRGAGWCFFYFLKGLSREIDLKKFEKNLQN